MQRRFLFSYENDLHLSRYIRKSLKLFGLLLYLEVEGSFEAATKGLESGIDKAEQDCVKNRAGFKMTKIKTGDPWYHRRQRKN
jgi:hypothetical protein